MGAAERVEGPVKDKLDAYVALIDGGQGDTDEARALRAELDAALPGDPRLHQADLEMQRRVLMAQIAGGR